MNAINALIDCFVIEDLACARALAHLGEFASMVRVVGSYPGSKPAAAMKV